MSVPKSINIKQIGAFGFDDTNNRWQALEIDANGNLKVALSASASIDIGDIQVKNSSGTVINPATSDKQLADNHQVTVSNIASTPLITGFATQATLQTIADAIGTIDSAIPTKGINILVKQEADDAHSTLDDGDGASLSVNHFKALRVDPQRAIDLANCNVSTDYTAISNDTINIANATNHVFGVGGISFDKVNGAANTIYGGVYKTFTAIDISEIFEAGGFVGLSCYLSSLTNVVGVFLRIGTDTTNYNTWFWPVADLTSATWLNLRKSAASPNYTRNTGNGWNTGAVSYVAFGVEFNSEANTLAGISFDHVHIVAGRITASDISTAVTSTVNTPNINMQRIGSGAGTAVDVGAGNLSAGTQRVTLASDGALPAGTNALGKLLPPDIDVTTHTNYKKFFYKNTGAVTDGIVWSPAAGKRWHIVWMIVNVSLDATVTFEDDKVAGDEIVAQAEIAANSGFPIVCPEKYPLASGEDAADLLITTTAGNVYVFGVGYEI